MQELNLIIGCYEWETKWNVDDEWLLNGTIIAATALDLILTVKIMWIGMIVQPVKIYDFIIMFIAIVKYLLSIQQYQTVSCLDVHWERFKDSIIFVDDMINA